MGISTIQWRAGARGFSLESADSRDRYTIAYMHVSEIDTPALVVDLDIMERNLARVADYAR